ncbi:hypothetical protein [Acidipropionibacterium acidipropionici]|uniref:hypothetical protein n=1 Tax=Acidipropionibacterium acidipropionici TaxID=1748 RepID=UPI0005A1257A|nr:hypothetical protein [Acidipropionibacterium acidipropionici]
MADVEPGVLTVWSQVQPDFSTHDQRQAVNAWRSADAWVAARVRFRPARPGWGTPEDLVQAVRLLTARYLARRNSPDGFLGMGEFGPARVPINDRDVNSLIAPYRRVVFG